MFSKLDPIILLLTQILGFLVIAAFVSEIFFKSDAVFFQFIQGLATTIMGALMMRVKPNREDHSADVVPKPPGPTVPPEPPEPPAGVTA